ncbi:MAG: AGE family epimerase/isomerase [Methylococcales bacterium]
MRKVSFTYSDTIAGYVTEYSNEKNILSVKTSAGTEFQITIAPAAYAQQIRNLGEDYIDCTGEMHDMLQVGRFLFVYGVFYPEDNALFEAERIVFVGQSESEYYFEKPNWWINQIKQLGDFYIKAQFPDGNIDFRNYTTTLDLYGHKTSSTRQETDTISRLVYGFASAYLLTGDERYLEAADKGTIYLREHFRAIDLTENICYWYHAIDISDEGEKKICGSNMAEIPGMRREKATSAREQQLFASSFGDDLNALPAYEQIYALAGPTQTYRITGDEKIRQDIDLTLNLFDRYYRDHDKGGYWSHIDPVTFSGTSAKLGRNRSRKNWNSVGDHAPAYLINLYLATGEKRHADMLIDTGDTIVERFPDDENSAFVQEKFHADWSPDRQWGWQQNRAVVGHNLKIAWNLMRMVNLSKNQKYVDRAKIIAQRMPLHGSDQQRGGWYDVVERALPLGQQCHRFSFHDRKAWWQQEQGILAYLILTGTFKTPEYLKLARETSAFYNAFFLDHDSGAVYFNVLANGIPYLLGTERNKGSHSMSGYHSFELCYLGAVYTNLLITKQSLDLYFKPIQGGFKDNVLRVAPDLLPEGSIRIHSVTVDGSPYTDFDATALTVNIPTTSERPKIRVRIVPTQGWHPFTINLDINNGKAIVTLEGSLNDDDELSFFEEALNKVIAASVSSLVLDFTHLDSMISAAGRLLIFSAQKLNLKELVVRGANPRIITMLDEITDLISFE